MQAFPVHTTSPIVYLTIGIPPAEATRGLEILALMDLVAMCCTELQDVTNIIKNNLQDYDNTLGVMRNGPHVGKVRSRDPPWYPRHRHFLPFRLFFPIGFKLGGKTTT